MECPTSARPKQRTAQTAPVELLDRSVPYASMSPSSFRATVSAKEAAAPAQIHYYAQCSYRSTGTPAPDPAPFSLAQDSLTFETRIICTKTIFRRSFCAPAAGQLPNQTKWLCRSRSPCCCSTSSCAQVSGGNEGRLRMPVGRPPPTASRLPLPPPAAAGAHRGCGCREARRAGEAGTVRGAAGPALPPQHRVQDADGRSAGAAKGK